MTVVVHGVGMMCQPGRHVDTVAALRPDTIAHGPLLTGDAFDRVRAMAAAPRVMPPGRSALDELVAATVLGQPPI